MEGSNVQIVMDITGMPKSVQENWRLKQTRLDALKQVVRDHFYCSVETHAKEGRFPTAPLTLLVTKARDCGAVNDENDEWVLVSWTAPVVTRLLAAAPGGVVEFQPGGRPGSTTIYKVLGRAEYESLFPAARRMRFDLQEGRLEAPDEDLLGVEEAPPATDSDDVGAVMAENGSPAALDDGPAVTQEVTAAGADANDVADFEETFAPESGTFEVTAAPPERNGVVRLGMADDSYHPTEGFGLEEIIAEADDHQRFAMHLPFDRHVLVEGPPGSGKTSIAIMRIPCLIDAQWDELGLDQNRDDAFYTEESCRILVVSQEMVDYLERLKASIKINRVPCRTFNDVFRRVCRRAGTLSGNMKPSKRRVRWLKGRPEAVRAAWAGFQEHVQTTWAAEKDSWTKRLVDADERGKPGDLESLIRTVDRWVRLVATTAWTPRLAASLNFADLASAWLAREADRRGGIERAGMRRLTEEVEKLGRTFARRSGWGAAMFATPAADDLRRLGAAQFGAEAASEAMVQWQESIVSDQPTYDEADVALAAWLALNVFSTARRPSLGAPLPAFRHVVVDEAQDMTPTHALCLPLLLDPKGTLTVVGDLRQSLVDGGGLDDWSALSQLDPVRRTFGVNYRQSLELGAFVGELYYELYGEIAEWRASDHRRGPEPMAVVEESIAKFAAAIAEQIRRARSRIDGATVAVLFDGKVDKTRLVRLRRRLERELADDLVEVHLSATRDGSQHLTRTDCVHILSVRQTKGLEFDAVVLADLYDHFSGPAESMLPERRNRLYVAASRAKQWFSMVLRKPPQMQTLADLAASE